MTGSNEQPVYKSTICRQIFARMYDKEKQPKEQRKAIVEAFKSEAGVSTNCANSYYTNNVNEMNGVKPNYRKPKQQPQTDAEVTATEQPSQ